MTPTRPHRRCRTNATTPGWLSGPARLYQLTLIDPGAAEVTRILGVADQLVLVAPASSDAPRSLGMTQEWLSGHGYGELSAGR